MNIDLCLYRYTLRLEVNVMFFIICSPPFETGSHLKLVLTCSALRLQVHTVGQIFLNARGKISFFLFVWSAFYTIIHIPSSKENTRNLNNAPYSLVHTILRKLIVCFFWNQENFILLQQNTDIHGQNK